MSRSRPTTEGRSDPSSRRPRRARTPTASCPTRSFRDGIIEHVAASPTYPGHAYLVYEDWDTTGGQFDVKLTQTTDGGATWSPPQTVNDAVPSSATTDQFQPSVAAGPGGAVAVTCYDRREVCPDDPSILPAHVGDANTCIDISLQPYKDTGTAAGATPVGGNVRVSEFTWDPDQSQQKVEGITQYACAAHTDPSSQGGGFIGDYFGLAISAGNVYTFGVSTHYPSPPSVTADGGGPVYYQNQVLGIVPRSTFGAGY
jgi:hypothetical protein